MALRDNLDNWFSYKTAKIVNIRDRRLGLLYLGIVFLIVVYIVVYVFIISKGYLEVQYTQGTVATKVKVTAYVEGRPDSSYYDEADIVVPPLEAEALFVATRIQTTADQARDWCLPEHDKLQNCTNNNQCRSEWFPAQGRCIDTRCQYFQWCPDEEDSIPVPTTVVEDVHGALEATVWFKGSIKFDKLNNAFYSTIHDKEPVTEAEDPAGANLFTIHRLIEKLPEEDRNFDSIELYGAILKVIVDWDCDTARTGREACTIKYDVQRLDNTGGPADGGGFNYRTAFYARDNGTTSRTLNKFYGVRIFVASSGKGYQVSAVPIILNIASGLALVGIATFVTDTLMLSVLDNDDKTYAHCKFQETQVLYEHDKGSESNPTNYAALDK